MGVANPAHVLVHIRFTGKPADPTLITEDTDPVSDQGTVSPTIAKF